MKNIFGVMLSPSDLYLLTIAGALVLLLLGVYLPASLKRRSLATAEFKEAFSDTILNLTENPDCPIAQFSYAFHDRHLVAIVNHREFVQIWNRGAFDRAVNNYKDAYKTAQDHGSVFATGLSENTEKAKQKREHYKKAINRLLRYA